MADTTTTCDCGEQLEHGFLVCPSCHAPTPSSRLTCGGCGKTVKARWKYCPYCEQPLSGWATPSNPAPTDTPFAGLGSNAGFYVTEQAGAVRRGETMRPDIQPGETLADRYTVRKHIGEGGFGAVYLVEDSVLQEQRAVKVVLAESGAGVPSGQSLLHEFKLRERITNTANVVRADDPRLCDYKGLQLVLLPMEYADGGSLRQWLAKNRDVQKRRHQAIELFKQACQGVRAIHEAGLSHLDLKPENVLLFSGVAKVTDLGLGRFVGSQFARNPDQIVRSGAGTPEYMSPEQFECARQKDISHASDIYSLGVLLYELLDGCPPFDGSRAELPEKHRKTPPEPLKGEVAKWWPIVERCLRKSAGDRYSSVGSLATDIERAAMGVSLLADVACKKCGRISENVESRSCECGFDLSYLFRECPRCHRQNRLDVEKCPCGYDLAGHFLRLDREKQLSAFQDEDPVAAIELLELMLQAGGGDEDANRIKDLRTKQLQITPWLGEAEKAEAKGDPQKAVELYKQIVRVFPRHRLATTHLTELKPLVEQLDARFANARSLSDRAQFEEAEAAYKLCLKLSPSNPAIRRALTDLGDRAAEYQGTLDHASRTLQRKELWKTLEHVEAALKHAPECPEILRIKREASESIERADAMIQRVEAHLAEADFAAAKETLGEVTRLQADHEKTTELSRTIPQREAEYSKAMSSAEQAEARAKAARNYDEAVKAWKKALEACNQALTLCPNAADAKALADRVREAESVAAAAQDERRKAAERRNKMLREIPGLLLSILLFCLAAPFVAAYYVCYGLWIVIKAVYRLW